MKRTIVLCALLALSALSLVVAAQQGGGQQARVVEAEKLKDNLWVLKGGGGNTAVFVTANGVVVVDAPGASRCGVGAGSSARTSKSLSGARCDGASPRSAIFCDQS